MEGYFRLLAETNFNMTTVPPETMDQRESANRNITIQGKFKSVNLYNDTIHIILYPQDGLRSAAKLQEIEEGTDLTLKVKEERF